MLSSPQGVSRHPVDSPRSTAHPLLVSLRRARHYAHPVLRHIVLPPAAVNPLELIRPHRLHDSAYRLCRQGNVVRIAAHERHPAPVRYYRDRVAGQQRALTAGPFRPVKHRTPVKMPAALNEPYPWQDLSRSLIPLDGSIRPGHPLFVSVRDVYGSAAERVAPFDD